MNTNRLQTNRFSAMLQRLHIHRGLFFGIILVGALLAFEVFNFSTTEFALHDLLGEFAFLGIAWATILALAFCGIDFAGIARLFTPGEGSTEPGEVWYLFGAWLLAASMNAILTWWGVSIAILNHQSLGNAVVQRETLLRAVPVFVAIMVWLIRVLIIGTFSVAGARLFTQNDARARYSGRPTMRNSADPLPVRSAGTSRLPATQVSSNSGTSFRPAPKPVTSPDLVSARPEPTYHPVTMSQASNPDGSRSTNKTPFSNPSEGKGSTVRMFNGRSGGSNGIKDPS